MRKRRYPVTRFFARIYGSLLGAYDAVALSVRLVLRGRTRDE